MTAQPGPVLLQGGAEMQPACRDMDRTALRLAPPGDVVVLLGAATPGVDHERAASRARRYYGDLDGRRVRVAPHPGTDLDGAVAALDGAGVVVLPGGSPSRLLAALRAGTDRLAAALLTAHRSGLALSGASAGAMVLCARTVLPDGGGGDGPAVADGLGLLPGLALVHDDGRDRRGWADPASPDGVRWGLPEAGGLLVHEGSVRAVGKGTPRLVRAGRSTAVPREPVRLQVLLPGAAGGPS